MKTLPVVFRSYSYSQPMISKKVASLVPTGRREDVWPMKTGLVVLNTSSTLLAFWLLRSCLLAFDSLPFHLFEGVGGALPLLYRIKPCVELSPLPFHIHIGPKALQAPFECTGTLLVLFFLYRPRIEARVWLFVNKPPLESWITRAKPVKPDLCSSGLYLSLHLFHYFFIVRQTFERFHAWGRQSLSHLSQSLYTL